MSNKTAPGTIQIDDVRLAFPNLFKAAQVNGQGDPKYGASFIISDEGTVAAVNKVIEQAALDKWGVKNGPTVLASLRKTDKVCLHAGDNKPYDGFAGNWYISTSAAGNARPGTFDKSGRPVTDEDGVLYAGCYVKALINIWAQDNQFGKRINAQVRAVKFWREGDAFSGGRPAAASEFDDAEEGADAADFA